MAKESTCCICGVFGKLSYEHVPPEAAFNDQRIFETNIQAIIKAGEEGRMQKGKWLQRGAGRNTLCEKCNSLTGHWYGTAYVSWAKQAKELLERAGGTLSLEYPYDLHPLRAIKEVMAMFCSVCGPELQRQFQDIPKFILDRDGKYIPHELRVYAYLLDPKHSSGGRQSPMARRSEGGKAHVFAEVAFDPLGFVLTGDVKPIKADLLDVTHFGHWSYRERRTLYLKMPVLPINTWLPGDFRTREELIKSEQDGEKRGRIDLDVLH